VDQVPQARTHVAIHRLFETAHTCFLWAWLYDITVSHFGSILALNSIPWSLAACLLAFCSNGAAVQAFFTFRIFVVSGNWWLAVPLWILQLVEVGTVVSIAVFTTRSKGFLEFKEDYNALVYVCLITCVVVRAIRLSLDVASY
jgi:hypothetical protein